MKIFIAIISLCSFLSSDLSAMDIGSGGGYGGGAAFNNILGSGGNVVGSGGFGFGFDEDQESFNRGWEKANKDRPYHYGGGWGLSTMRPQEPSIPPEPKIMPESLFDSMNAIIVRVNKDGNSAFLQPEERRPWAIQIRARAIFDKDPVLYQIWKHITAEDYRCPVAYVILKTEDKPQWRELQQYFVDNADRLEEELRLDDAECTIL